MPYADPKVKTEYMRRYHAARRAIKKTVRAVQAASLRLLNAEGSTVRVISIMPGDTTDNRPLLEYNGEPYMMQGTGHDGLLVFKPYLPIEIRTVAAPDSHDEPAPAEAPASAIALPGPDENPVSALDGSPSILGSRYLATERLWDKLPIPPTKDEGRVTHNAGDPDETFSRQRRVHLVRKVGHR